MTRTAEAAGRDAAEVAAAGADPAEAPGGSAAARLFFGSALLAGACLGGGSPTVVSVAGAHPGAWLLGQEEPAATAGWQEAAALAAAHLGEGPVVLVARVRELLAEAAADTDQRVDVHADSKADAHPEAVAGVHPGVRPDVVVDAHAEADAHADAVADLDGDGDAHPPLTALLDRLEPPSADALLGVLLPASLITSRRHQDFRTSLARRWQPAGAVYSTGALPEVHPTEQLVLLYLRPRSPQPSSVHVFRVPRVGEGAELAGELRQLLAHTAGATAHGYVLPQPWAAQDNWRFDPAAAEVAPAEGAEPGAGKGSARSFGDLFDRVATVRKDAFPHLAQGAPGAVRLLRFRDFSGTGTLVPADGTDAVWAAIPAERQLRAGDVVMQSVLHESATRGPAVAVVAPEDLPAALEGSMNFALRLKEPVEEHYVRLLVAYLNSAVVQRYAAGSTIRRLQWGQLQGLPLPAPDEALANALDDLNEARRRTLSWHREATALRQSSFTDGDREAARQRVIAEGRVLRLRVEAAAQLDDPDYIYRTTLPYPIALRWRDVEAKVSVEAEPGRAYQAALATAEILFCYCALVAAALAHGEGVTIPRMAAVRARLATGGTPPGFGDWVAVLQELPSAVRHLGLPPNHPLTDFTVFGADEDVLAARVRLYGRRNDEAHERRADELDLPGALQTALADLRFLLDRALFLADLPLAHVTLVRWDALRKRAVVDHHRLMGDHPIVPISALEQDHPGIEVGSLYVIDGERRLHLLRPFLTRQLCPRCRAWSTFHLDRTHKRDVLLKSLEHGHSLTLEDPVTRAALQHVGLL